MTAGRLSSVFSARRINSLVGGRGVDRCRPDLRKYAVPSTEYPVPSTQYSVLSTLWRLSFARRRTVSALLAPSAPEHDGGGRPDRPPLPPCPSAGTTRDAACHRPLPPSRRSAAGGTWQAGLARLPSSAFGWNISGRCRPVIRSYRCQHSSDQLRVLWICLTPAAQFD